MSAASLLQVALDCIARGWHVFPCWPESKKPMTAHGWKDATLDENQVRAWWTRQPAGNVAIATGPSNLAVLDIDKGVPNNAEARAWMGRNGVPETYAVRTGRRDGYGLQLYYEGRRKSLGGWELDGCSGDIKSEGGYVMAAGSVHPDSKEPYIAVIRADVEALPDAVRTIQGKTTDRTVLTSGAPITENRNDTMIRLLGKHRAEGNCDASVEAQAHFINETRVQPPLDEAELERIVANACKYPIGQADPRVIIGGKLAGGAQAEVESKPEEPMDWRDRYHTLTDLETVTPATFMVDQILHQDSIVGLAGYAGDRKSIVSLNLASACVTGTPFMGRFAVTNPPKRVLYLCPEMGLRELAERVRGLDMAAHVGKSLFFRTLDKQGALRLPDMSPEELDGALVILDTAIRFLEGSENDPQDMARFAEQLFRLRSAGATVWVLFHSSKASAGQDLTLQNAVRGSSELAAMLSACWGTRLLDPKDRFGSNSRLFPLKTREFEAFPFDFAVDRATAACEVVGDPAPEAVLRNRKDGAALEVLRRIVEADPGVGIGKIRERMKAAGHGKGQSWVARVLPQVRGTGVEIAG